jgi:broad specificity phosphatase PhoE
MSDEADTIVHLVRHGEVENPHGVLYGRIPGYHLSADGRVMAKAAANFLAGRDVTVLRSSPLERAQETAEPIAAQFGLPVETDDRLIEPWNHFEGLTFGVGDGSLRRPRHWAQLWNPFRPSWGEPYGEVAARMRVAMADAAATARGHEAVLVSHQLPIWVARRSVEGRKLWHDPRRRQCALGSVTSFSYRGGGIVGVSYAEPAGAGRGQVAGA